MIVLYILTTFSQCTRYGALRHYYVLQHMFLYSLSRPKMCQYLVLYIGSTHIFKTRMYVYTDMNYIGIDQVIMCVAYKSNCSPNSSDYWILFLLLIMQNIKMHDGNAIDNYKPSSIVERSMSFNYRTCIGIIYIVGR